MEVADRLRAVCRDDDLVARLGGDEFVVLLSSTAADTDTVAVSLADRLVVALAQPFLVADRLVSLGGSVGIAHARGPADEADQGDALLRRSTVRANTSTTRDPALAHAEPEGAGAASAAGRDRRALTRTGRRLSPASSGRHHLAHLLRRALLTKDHSCQ